MIYSIPEVQMIIHTFLGKMWLSYISKYIFVHFLMVNIACNASTKQEYSIRKYIAFYVLLKFSVIRLNLLTEFWILYLSPFGSSRYHLFSLERHVTTQLNKPTPCVSMQWEVT